MRIVVDTNVFVSGIFFTGPPYQILNAWRSERVGLVASPEILVEYRRVVEELSEQFPQIDASEFLHLLIVNAEIVVAPPLPEPVCNDADDDKFLACAIAGSAKLIVSGDKHLKDISPYGELTVLSPRAFVSRYL